MKVVTNSCPGDQIEINAKGIFVNSKLFNETIDLGLPDSTKILKDNEYYVVGDNTGNKGTVDFLDRYLIAKL